MQPCVRRRIADSRCARSANRFYRIGCAVAVPALRRAASAALLSLLLFLFLLPAARGETLVAAELLDMTVGEVAGLSLVDPRGLALGNIESLARNRFDGEIYVLVALDDEGGRDRQTALPLERLQPQGGNLVTSSPTSVETLLTIPFDPVAFEPIDDTLLLREVVGVRPAPAGSAGREPRR